LRGRYYELYTKQHGVESNLFLAPGEGDAAMPQEESLKASAASALELADALRLVKGEIR